jgi:hypothetical protein
LRTTAKGITSQTQAEVFCQLALAAGCVACIAIEPIPPEKSKQQLTGARIGLSLSCWIVEVCMQKGSLSTMLSILAVALKACCT